MQIVRLGLVRKLFYSVKLQKKIGKAVIGSEFSLPQYLSACVACGNNAGTFFVGVNHRHMTYRQHYLKLFVKLVKIPRLYLENTVFGDYIGVKAAYFRFLIVIAGKVIFRVE